ncbi:MAG: IS21 family transposase, partial [Bacteroidetes bacterium]|nr:IS21 family transposase [Bacteroidota bacterium]
HYYSVPFRFIGKKAKVSYTRSTVDIYHNYKRIAIHQRNKNPYGYTSIKEHLPSAHRFVSEWKPEKFINWAKAYGVSVYEYILRVLDNHQHPEQNYKSCIGILSLEKKYGKERLNQACSRGIYYDNYSFRVIKNILEKGMDQLKEESVQCQLPLHENIRGEHYYQ